VQGKKDIITSIHSNFSSYWS